MQERNDKENQGRVVGVDSEFAPLASNKPSAMEKHGKAVRPGARKALLRDKAELRTMLDLCRMFRLPESSLDDLSRFIVAECVRMSKSKIGFFGLVNEEGTLITTHTLPVSAMADCELVNSPMERSLLTAGMWAEAIRERKAIIINDYQKPDSRKKGYPRGHVPISRFMSIPLVEGDRTVSFVTVANSNEEYREDSYLHLHLFLECFWGILKHKQAEEALKKAYAEMESLVQEQTRESEALYHQFFQNSVAGTFRSLYDPSGCDGRYVDCNNTYANILGYASRDELIKLPISAAFLSTGDLVAYIQDIMKRKRLSNYQFLLQRKNGKPVCVLLNAQLSAYTNDHMLVEGTMVDITERVEAEKQVLASNELLRSLTSELVMTEERERRNIAVDVHDHIAQTLTLAKMKLETVLERASGYDLTFIKPLLVIDGLIDQSVQQTRSLMADISPAALYELGLSEAIEWLCDHVHTRCGLTVVLNHHLPIKLIDEGIKLFIFRATRELLLNVAKHAKVKEANVTLQREGKNIMIMVRDKGAGFDGGRRALKAQHRGGFGLLSIRERLKYLGGSMEIITGKGKGTCVKLVAPQKGKNKRWNRKEHYEHLKAFRP